jgi:cob(I)alamin adenosyltransferase
MQKRELATAFLQRTGDPGYRLPGENPATATLDQARRWARRYEELIKFKRELLEICARYAGRSEPEVAHAIRETDVVLLETQVARYEQKRDYWQIRVAEMQGGRSRSPD